jgi:transposase
VRDARLWQRLVGMDGRRVVVEGVEFDEEAGAVVVYVRPRRPKKRRCGRCGARAPLYDQGQGRRRWRGLDLGTTRVFPGSDAPRVSCPVHGVVVAPLPWARHGAGQARDFDDTAVPARAVLLGDRGHRAGSASAGAAWGGS